MESMDNDRFSVGDVIESKYYPGVRRVITRVRKRGYSWRYAVADPEIPAEWEWDSENSTDPQFTQWHLVERSSNTKS